MLFSFSSVTIAACRRPEAKRAMAAKLNARSFGSQGSGPSIRPMSWSLTIWTASQGNSLTLGALGIVTMPPKLTWLM
jgi:hypothetical protein